MDHGIPHQIHQGGGRPAGREGLLVGLKNGQVSHNGRYCRVGVAQESSPLSLQVLKVGLTEGYCRVEGYIRATLFWYQ